MLALAVLLLLGAGLRLYKFPSIPVGLHQDEMSEAYESYSLLHTGKDRWGYRWPAYFLSWGSGQNVMQSYLTIPFVAVLGMTKVSARIVPLLSGLLLLPLLFVTVRRWHSTLVAVTALLFLACSPWGVMTSRLGVENVELPFFMLLGVYTYGRALRSRSRWVILLSLLPFAGALYCYGTVVVVVPVLLALLLVLGLGAVRQRPGSWAGALAIFSVSSAPIGLFVIKNYITKANYGFERWLPFSVPLLPISRLAQASAELAGQSLLRHNLGLLRRGLNDNVAWFQVLAVHPLPKIVVFLAVLGAAVSCWQVFRSRRLREPFLPWLVACVPLFVAVPLNISRSIALFVPLIVMAAVGFHALLAAMRAPAYRIAVTGICGVLLLLPTLRFVHDYYGPVYAGEVAPTLYPELAAALEEVQRLGPAQMPIYVSDTILLNYVDVLFTLKIDPRRFQDSGATWDDPDFGRFRFSRQTALQAGRSIAFLLAHGEPPLCPTPTETHKVGALEIGVCE